MNDKQTIKERVYILLLEYSTKDAINEIDKAYHDHFIEMIDEEIKQLTNELEDLPVQYLTGYKRGLVNIKSKLMEGNR